MPNDKISPNETKYRITSMVVYMFNSPVNPQHPFIHLRSYFVFNSEASQSATTWHRMIYDAYFVEIQQLVSVICHQWSPKGSPKRTPRYETKDRTVTLWLRKFLSGQDTTLGN